MHPEIYNFLGYKVYRYSDCTNMQNDAVVVYSLNAPLYETHLNTHVDAKLSLKEQAVLVKDFVDRVTSGSLPKLEEFVSTEKKLLFNGFVPPVGKTSAELLAELDDMIKDLRLENLKNE